MIILEDYFEKQKAKMENEIQLAIITAHYTVAFDRTKKLPKLADCIDKISSKKHKKQVMSDEQMFDVVNALNTAFGGEVI